MIRFLIALAGAYVLGSFPSAYVIGKLAKGIDIRQHGSGNVGASNVFRVVGKKWGILTLLLDISKGVMSVVVIAPHFYEPHVCGSKLTYSLFVGLAAVVGHNWTIFLGLRGGKGVATSLGVGVGLLPKAALLALSVWIVVLLLSGYISVASIAAALSFPVWVLAFYRHLPGYRVLLALSTLLAGLIVFTHRSNMERLRRGDEHRLWKK